MTSTGDWGQPFDVELDDGVSQRSGTMRGQEAMLELTLTITDYRKSTVTLLRSDGMTATVPLGRADTPASTAIAKSFWSPGVPALMFETDAGDQIVAELPRFDDDAPLHGRSVICLDQNHWSTLALALYAPERIRSPARLDAARHIIDLVRARKIVLPMSAGNMSETCKWSKRDERYRLALTILQLSAGWQMRDPLEVRPREIRAALIRRYHGCSDAQVDVFTLEPNAVHSARGCRTPQPPADFPAEMAFTWMAMTSLSANFATMLDDEHLPMDGPASWVDKMQRFTDWMASEPPKSSLRRGRSNLLFTVDATKEIAQAAASAAITSEQLSNWFLTHCDVDIAEMPALGLFREVVREKVFDPGTRWEGNDLHDLLYLTCATGYADYVVAENRTAADMEQALRRLGRPLRVYRRLEQLATELGDV